MKTNYKILFTALGCLVVGLLLGWWLFAESANQPINPSTHQHTNTSAHQHSWTCAMHPQIREEEAGQCPICGMDLIPVSSMEAETVADDEIQMTEAAAKIANVQTSVVQKSSPSKEIYLSGKIQADERRMADIAARFGGRIEKLYVNFTGQQVSKGQKLVSMYSPELITAQKELFEAAKFRETNPSYYESAVNKLKLWDLTDAQIQDIMESKQVQYHFNVLSPQSGTVVNRNISQGDYVQEGASLLEVVNLDKVWVQFDAYENDLSWIEVGDEISFTVQSVPGKTFNSKITFIDPVIDAQTRVASVRTEVNNPDDLLKPAMFVQGVLQAGLDQTESTLVIPSTSVLWTGKRAVVYVQKPEATQPTFEYREVVLGPKAGDQYVVLEGLEEGEEVVSNGVFKVDAAAQLNGKISMMHKSGSKGAAGHDHGSMGEMPSAQKQMKDFSKQTPGDFRVQLDQVMKAYLGLKESLVKADEKAAQKNSAALLEAIDQVESSGLESSAKAFWQEKVSILKKYARICKEASSIEGKQENFIHLSQAMINVIEAFGVSQQPLYVYFCPMANGNQGAYWLSEVKEIRNPYMGAQMINCGSVEQTID